MELINTGMMDGSKVVKLKTAPPVDVAVFP